MSLSTCIFCSVVWFASSLSELRISFFIRCLSSSWHSFAMYWRWFRRSYRVIMCASRVEHLFSILSHLLTVHRTCHSAKQCCLLKLKFRYSWECLTIHFHYNSVSIWLSVVLRDRKAFFWSTNGFRRWDVFILMTFSGMMPKPSSV